MKHLLQRLYDVNASARKETNSSDLQKLTVE